MMRYQGVKTHFSQKHVIFKGVTKCIYNSREFQIYNFQTQNVYFTKRVYTCCSIFLIMISHKCVMMGPLHVISVKNCILMIALWESHCESRIQGDALWEVHCGSCIVRVALWELHCGICIVGVAFWEQCSENCILGVATLLIIA